MSGYRPMVYVAGPITGDPFGCVAKAMRAFEHLWSSGLLPYLPQLSVIGEMVSPQDYELWMELDFEIIIVEHWPESATSLTSRGFGVGLAAAIHERNGQTS